MPTETPRSNGVAAATEERLVQLAEELARREISRREQMTAVGSDHAQGVSELARGRLAKLWGLSGGNVVEVNVPQPAPPASQPSGIRPAGLLASLAAAGLLGGGAATLGAWLMRPKPEPPKTAVETVEKSVGVEWGVNGEPKKVP